MEKRHPVDGIIDFGALSGIQTATLNFFGVASGDLVKETNLRWAFDNDDRNIYIGIEWSDDTKDNVFDLVGGELFNYDMIRLRLDNDGNGAYEAKEDHRRLIAVFEGSLYRDGHGDGFVDDLIGDGIASMAYDASKQVWQAEFLFPIRSDAEGEDADLSMSTRYNFVFYDKWSPFKVGNLAAQGDGLDSSAWSEVVLKTAEPHEYPTIPEQLTGLIVFVSWHEVAVGEIYTFDPATRLVIRVTQDPTLHKNAVSLSHDRRKIAFHGTRRKTEFHGALDQKDLGSFEIYVVDVDGSNLEKITNNSFMNLHPAWSPDDSRIAYSSFREFPYASTIVMTVEGAAELTDLTADGFDDSDVEYLRDGRLVFKTSRFNAFPILNMAVVAGDGTGLTQVTYNTNSSDHDPIGDPSSTFIMFERFMKNTDYNADPEAVVTPWNIIEARVDGTGERTIVADGWINSTPVYDPTGAYIAYLRLPGYNEVRLTTRDGVPFGRLIPDITRIEFLDWK